MKLLHDEHTAGNQAKTRNNKGKLTVRILPKDTEEEYAVPSVLIEGDSTALDNLADLIHSMKDGPTCGYHISVRGPGSIRFTKESTIGIYIHRLPCDNDQS